MAEGNAMLPMGILFLGIAAIAGFMAFRPWPVDPSSTKSPLSPGVYVAEILSGKPPSASEPPDRDADIAVIEGGLLTLIGVWATSKMASALSGLTSAGGSGAAESDEDEEDLGGNKGILGDVESAGGDLVKDVEEGAGE